MMQIHRHRGAGFSLLELILVIAVVSIVAAIGAPLYIGWRADALSVEATRTVERAIAVGRADAKRRATSYTFEIANGSETIQTQAGTVTIPNGGRFAVDPADSPRTITFNGALGVQPYEPEIVSFDVVTGGGAFERTATVSVLPPLGKTVVAR